MKSQVLPHHSSLITHHFSNPLQKLFIIKMMAMMMSGNLFLNGPQQKRQKRCQAQM